MARTNLRTTTKYKDELVGEDFKVAFEYESLDGVISGAVSAVAVKNGISTYVSKNTVGGGQTINSPEFDAELITTVLNEIDSIIAQEF